MSYLESVIAHGNMRQPGSVAHQNIVCADGFMMSVIAGGGAYSSPRYNDPGPYSHVEVGFPSERPEPWDDMWEGYLDGGSIDPTESVYPWVPIDDVRALVASHGGERS